MHTDPFEPDDKRQVAPATARNRDPILAVLQKHLPPSGCLLEIASGTGEHAVYMAPHFPAYSWQPTDIDPARLESIDAWRKSAKADTVQPARKFDVLADPWDFPDLAKPVTAVLAVNLIHIAPIAVTHALFEQAGRNLQAGNFLITYGPYKRGGAHTAPSNEAFDQSLKARNPNWGIRDMEYVTETAAAHGFELADCVDMPANNYTLVFKKV
ncbi:SAM-dependent methyltransferase [Kordiimonas sediminis]|uniref:SAM-dependent methyltransferase n=1 Tax=Kordiimonas sediminis TaxID=1735581 RepID=A0A919E376_9PROT|nr:DUF938 domain-containing protein [Kordiimonas sediminis]GHF14921.1 SAM-dependent methyltransferase [Kordiimonas sediminis]